MQAGDPWITLSDVGLQSTGSSTGSPAVHANTPHAQGAATGSCAAGLDSQVQPYIGRCAPVYHQKMRQMLQLKAESYCKSVRACICLQCNVSQDQARRSASTNMQADASTTRLAKWQDVLCRPETSKQVMHLLCHGLLCALPLVW